MHYRYFLLIMIAGCNASFLFCFPDIFPEIVKDMAKEVSASAKLGVLQGTQEAVSEQVKNKLNVAFEQASNQIYLAAHPEINHLVEKQKMYDTLHEKLQKYEKVLIPQLEKNISLQKKLIDFAETNEEKKEYQKQYDQAKEALFQASGQYNKLTKQLANVLTWQEKKQSHSTKSFFQLRIKNQSERIVLE